MPFPHWEANLEGFTLYHGMWPKSLAAQIYPYLIWIELINSFHRLDSPSTRPLDTLPPGPPGIRPHETHKCLHGNAWIHHVPSTNTVCALNCRFMATSFLDAVPFGYLCNSESYQARAEHFFLTPDESAGPRILGAGRAQMPLSGSSRKSNSAGSRLIETLFGTVFLLIRSLSSSEHFRKSSSSADSTNYPVE